MRLKRDGFVVLDSFLSGEELVRLQMEAELVLEASGAYDADPCDPGGCGHPSMTATGSRGCIFEVTRPLGHSVGQARTAPALPKSQHTPRASVQLAGMGLLASPRLLALMEAVFGLTDPGSGAQESTSQCAGGLGADQQLPRCAAELQVTPAALQHHSDGISGCPAPAALGAADSGSAGSRSMHNRDTKAAMRHHHHYRQHDGDHNHHQGQASVDGDDHGDGACGGGSSRPGRSGSTGAAGPLLFNEQFILKPPRSAYSSAFAWHRDSDWCRDGCKYDYSPYVSLWVALDDMTQDNGALAVLPGSHMRARCSSARGQPLAAAAAPSARGGAAERIDVPRQGTAPAPAPSCSSHPGCAAPGQVQEQGSPPGQDADGCGAGAGAPVQLHVPAGTAVLFWDTLLHASGPNTSRHTRRAWMPQFCSRPITRRSDGQLVALAVPLRSLVAPEGS